MLPTHPPNTAGKWMVVMFDKYAQLRKLHCELQVATEQNARKLARRALLAEAVRLDISLGEFVDALKPRQQPDAVN